jgi:hypothetical protein
MTQSPSLATSTTEAFMKQAGIPNWQSAKVTAFPNSFSAEVGDNVYRAGRITEYNVHIFTCETEHSRPLTHVEAIDLIAAIKRSIPNDKYAAHAKFIDYLQSNLPAATSCPETPLHVETRPAPNAKRWAWSLVNE